MRIRMIRAAAISIAAALLSSTAVHAAPGGGAVLFRTQGADSVTFDHERHNGRSRLMCRECHYRVFRAAAHQDPATMNDMRQGRSCGFCHNGTRAFGVDGHCSLCHRGG